MISTGSNDLFPNKLNLWWIRLAVMLIIFPVVAVALKSLDILQGYLTLPALVRFPCLSLV